MKEPHPFEPHWSVVVGPLKEQGRGLLPYGIAKKMELVDEFNCGPVRVFPKTGKIFLGNHQMVQVSPGKLLWFRRMRWNIATQDENHSAANCLWYGAGIDNGSFRTGFKILEDGSVRNGID